MNIPRLSEDDREKCEGLLTYEECKKSLETFQNEKSPREDGFTVEFYKFFFELLGTDLVTSLNAAYELGELSISVLCQCSLTGGPLLCKILIAK